jgi:nitroreductase
LNSMNPTPVQTGTTATDILENLLTARHSCRAFLSTPLPRVTIENLLSIAQRTPSWCNTQPWRVHIVSGAVLDEFRGHYVGRARQSEGSADLELPLAYRGEYLARRRECGIALYSSLGIAREDKVRAAEQALENYRFFGAPHLAVISTERDLGAYGAVDCGGYISVFLLASASLGIAAVPQAAVAMHSAFVREFLKIPDGRQIVAGIAFGLERTDHPSNAFRTTRADTDDVVTWVGEPVR